MCVCVSAAVESTGAAKAEAQSRAEAARIQGEAAVSEAKLKAEAQKIEAVSFHKLLQNILLCVCAGQGRGGKERFLQHPLTVQEQKIRDQGDWPLKIVH